MLFEGKIPSKARSLGDSCAARDGRRVEECLVRARREVGAAAARADAGGREGGPSRRLQRLRRLRGGGWHPSARSWAYVDSHAHRSETGSQGGCVLQRQRCSQNAKSSENDRAPHNEMIRSCSSQKEAALMARSNVFDPRLSCTSLTTGAVRAGLREPYSSRAAAPELCLEAWAGDSAAKNPYQASRANKAMRS